MQAYDVRKNIRTQENESRNFKNRIKRRNQTITFKNSQPEIREDKILLALPSVIGATIRTTANKAGVFDSNKNSNVSRETL